MFMQTFCYMGGFVNREASKYSGGLPAGRS